MNRTVKPISSMSQLSRQEQAKSRGPPAVWGFGRTTGGCGARYDGSLKKHGLTACWRSVEMVPTTFSLQEY